MMVDKTAEPISEADIAKKQVERSVENLLEIIRAERQLNMELKTEIGVVREENVRLVEMVARCCIEVGDISGFDTAKMMEAIRSERAPRYRE